MFNFKGTKKLQGESPRPGERSGNVRYILTLSDGKYSYAVNSERMEGRRQVMYIQVWVEGAWLSGRVARSIKERDIFFRAAQ